VTPPLVTVAVSTSPRRERLRRRRVGQAEVDSDVSLGHPPSSDSEPVAQPLCSARARRGPSSASFGMREWWRLPVTESR
jgi:hypothetical protein